VHESVIRSLILIPRIDMNRMIVTIFSQITTLNHHNQMFGWGQNVDFI